MKKLTAMLIAVLIVFSYSVNTFASDYTTVNEQITQETLFTTIKVPFPDTIEEYKSWISFARFKDNGDPITLSMFYDGYIYATVPTKDAAREIEVFLPEVKEFTDYDESEYKFHDLLMLSRTDVIRGNEKGEALPFGKITRAEIAAMILRFMGLDSFGVYDGDFAFSDVNKDDWFYNEVMSAYSLGIIEGDSETTFSPNRNVTREEAVVMVARALKTASLRCPKVKVSNNIDENRISEWAKWAYEYIGTCYPSDYDDSDYMNPVRILGPQRPATRYDVAYVLNNVKNACQLYASDLAISYGFDKDMPIIDGSTSTYPFTQSVYTKLFCNGPSHEKFPYSHSKSHASYERLINGEVDMLFASVYPASDILALAKEKHVELELIPIAYDAMIFFTNIENPATGLTKEQITDIYVNNAYENWNQIGGSDALLYPYCRNNDSGSHAQMEKHFLNGGEIHPEVQKETSFTMSNVLTDVQSSITTDPKGYGLGYSIYYYYHNMDLFYNTTKTLKLLAIDGVYPTDKTIADGTYPLANNTYIVLRKDTPEDSPARKMVDFMLSDEGQECVEVAGYGRLIPESDENAGK